MLTYGSPRATGGRSIWSLGPAPSRSTSPASTTPGRCCVSRASLTASTTGSWRCPNRGPTWAWHTQTSHARRRASAAWWGWTSFRGACSWTSGSWARGTPAARNPSPVSFRWTRGRCASGCCWTTRPGRWRTTARDRCGCTPSTAPLHKRCSQPAGSGRASSLLSVNRDHERIWSWGNRCIPTVAEPETHGLPSPSFTPGVSEWWWDLTSSGFSLGWFELICGELRKSRNILHASTWMQMLINVTLDHKTSHKGQFCEIENYTSSESWINKLSIVC